MTPVGPLSASGAGQQVAGEHAPAVCVRVDRAMRMLDIDKTKLYQLMGAGELKRIRIGRRTLVLQASIDSLVERLRQRNPRDEAAWLVA